MEISFTLPLKAFSINKVHCRDSRYFTAEFQDWRSAIEYRLDQIHDIHAVADKWRASGGTFEVTYTAVYPPAIFYTREGLVSAKTIDCTNHEKVIQDVLFDRMKINDKFVTAMHSFKRPGTGYSLEITLKLNPDANHASSASVSLSPDDNGPK